MAECRLRDLEIGDAARIVGFAPTHRSYRSKLLSMGLTRGTLIVVKNIAPLGDPVHVSVRDFELSLRKDEADALILSPEPHPENVHRRRHSGPHGPGRGWRPGASMDHRPGAGHGRRHGHNGPWRRWLRRNDRLPEEPSDR